MPTQHLTHCFPCQALFLQLANTNARPDNTPQPRVYCTAVPIADLLPKRVVRGRN